MNIWGIIAGIALIASMLPATGGVDESATAPCGRAWTIVPSPNPDPEHNTLRDVSAVSSSDAWAVGGAFDQSRGEFSTLIEHWDGTSWSIVPSPNVGTLGNHLEGVAALTADDVWAVGSRSKLINGVFVPVPLILHWDGSSWSTVPAPGRGTPPNGILGGILAIKPHDVWAVGSHAISPLHSVDFGRETLIEHWDGRRWSVVPSPNVPTMLASTLDALAATNRRDVWAVGASSGEDSGRATLVEHWNDSDWTIVDSPNRVDPRLDFHDNSLRDVVALSRRNVWAVGEGEGKTLTAHWDGTNWSVVPSPAPGLISGLYAADGNGRRRSVAVGTFLKAGTFDFLTLSMRWDGRRWRRIPSENVPGAFDNRLEGLALTKGRQFAVGTSAAPEGEHTLIQQRCPAAAFGLTALISVPLSSGFRPEDLRRNVMTDSASQSSPPSWA